MKIKKAKAEAPKVEKPEPPADESVDLPVPENVEAPQAVVEASVVEEPAPSIVAPAPVKQQDVKVSDEWEFVKCRAKKTVLVRGMPQFEGDEFMHYKGQAETAAARGDLELI